MAGEAFEGDMCPGQRELSLTVIKCRRFPTGSGVARSAILREIVTRMVGIGSAVVVILMA